MVRKLIPNRISTTIPPENLAAFKKKLQEARELIAPTPVVSDKELKGYEKMGGVKRNEADDTVDVLVANGSFLPPVLGMDEVKKDLTVYDILFDFIKEVDGMSNDLQRFQTIAGCEAINVLRIAEDKAYADAALGNEDAIRAVNEIDKLPRSTDKKPTKTTKKEAKTGI